MHHRITSLVGIALCALLGACQEQSAPVAPTEVKAELRRAAEPSTALLFLALETSGMVRITDVRPKPIPWRGTSAAPPALSGASASAGEELPKPAEDARYLVIADHPERAEPFGLYAELGAPGEGGGDVVDRWATGAQLLRAPHFGPGTRYRVLRLHPRGDRWLGSWEGRR